MKEITEFCISVVLAASVAFSSFVGAEEAADSKLTLIREVSIFDGENEKLLKNMHVLVRGNLIEKISDEPLAVSDNSDNLTVIHGGGRMLMPGLIDAHWHSMYSSLPLATLLTSDIAYMSLVASKANEGALMRGFTTVRDIGG